MNPEYIVTFSRRSRLALAPNKISTMSWYPASTPIWRAVCCLFLTQKKTKMKQLEKHIHVQNNKICNKRIQVTPSSLLSLFNTQENENGMFSIQNKNIHTHKICN